MGESNIIIYVPPALFSIVAAAFLVLWRLRVILSWHWSAGFAQTALGFVLSTFSIHPVFDAFSSGLVFIGAAYCYGEGLLIHFGGPRFHKLRLSLIAVYTAGLAYLVFVAQSLIWQLFLTDAGFALQLGIAVVCVSRRAVRRVDIALVAASAVVVLDSVLRTVFFTFFTDSSSELGDFADSAYNLAVHLSTITVCMIFPFTALGAIASAAIDRHRDDAERDPLTGLLNRRGFDKTISRDFDDKISEGAVLVFDIDHFKRINDSYGHAIGDLAIVALADLLTEVVPKTGYTARAGGEEFVAFIPSVSLENAIQCGNRVRSSFAARNWGLVGIGNPVTVSVGISQILEEDNTLLHAFLRADNALYNAKSSGRDRVCVSGPIDKGREPVTSSAGTPTVIARRSA